MTEILIQNADTILTMDDTRRELSGADILIRDGQIVTIGANLTTSGSTVSAVGCVVTPGLVNTHHHLFQTLTRAVPGGAGCAAVWLATNALSDLVALWARGNVCLGVDRTG